MKSAPLAGDSIINYTLSVTKLIISICQHILSLLSVSCLVSSFPRTAKGLLFDTLLLQTRPSDSGQAVINVCITAGCACFRQLGQKAHSPQGFNNTETECWVFMGRLCSTAQFPSIRREVLIQILMCTLVSLLLDHENNSSSEAEELKENVSIATNLMHENVCTATNLMHVALIRLNSQRHIVKSR